MANSPQLNYRQLADRFIVANRQPLVDESCAPNRQQLVDDSRNIPQLVEKSEHIEPRRGEIA